MELGREDNGESAVSSTYLSNMQFCLGCYRGDQNHQVQIHSEFLAQSLGRPGQTETPAVVAITLSPGKDASAQVLEQLLATTAKAPCC